MGAYELSRDKDLNDEISPLVNLLNEMLARKLKIALARLNNSSEDSTKEIAVKLAQRLLGITPENSPQPNPDIMTEEPTLAAVRDSCQHWADMNYELFPDISRKLGLSADSIYDYVNDTLLPYLQTFHFALSLQKLLLETNSSWDQLVQTIELNGKIPEKLILDLSPKLIEIMGKTIYDYLKLDERQSGKVSETMFLQGLLCHDSQFRHDIDLKNVLYSDTLQDIVIDLRIAPYFDACKVKRQQWLQVIGNITFEQAFSGDESVFEHMIGRHTHGLNREQFWAMARAAKDNQAKRDIFIRKSNEQYLAVSISSDRSLTLIG